MEEMSILSRYLYWEQLVLMGVVLSVTLLLWKILWSKKQHISLPPGSTGWPLIGESISFYRGLRSLHPRRFIEDHEKRYGQVFRSNLFGRAHMVVSVDPEFNKYVLQNEGRLFQANYPQSVQNILGKYALVNVHGELQRKLHATAANLLKQDRLISDFLDDIQNALIEGIQRWQHKSDIHLQHECNKLLLNIMGKKLLDLPPHKDTEEIYEAFEAFVEALLQIPIKFPGSIYARGIKVEHDSLLNKNGNKKMTWDNYQEMKFTHCVIKETLRLSSVAHGAIREAKQDVKFKDFIIPKGWSVYVLLVGTHLDEKYYPEPFTFNPWRWKNESTLELSNNPWYMPFGKGARLCPGYHLARFEIALFLHSFVTKFRWEVIEDDRLCYYPIPTMVKGFPIRLYDRKQHPNVLIAS